MSSLAPLESIRYCILLALATKSLHGYAIQEQIDRDGGQLVHLDYSTIYKALKRLEEDRLIQRDTRNKDSRQIRYRLTPQGKRTLIIETDRLERAIRLVGERLK